MRTLRVVTVLLAVTAATQPAAADDTDFTGPFVGGRFGFGRNVSPTRGDISAANVYQPMLQGGFVFLDDNVSGGALGATLAYTIGANDATTSEPLAGGFFRIAKAGVYGELGGLTGLTSAKHRASLVEVNLGFGLPIGHWAPAIAAGAQVGQTRDDGFVAIGTLTIAVDRYFTRGHRQPPRGGAPPIANFR
jgi:hypothetical protein